MTFSQYFHTGYFVGNKFTMLCFVQVSAYVLASAAGSNKFMTGNVLPFQLNWPDKEKKISLSGLDLYSVSSFQVNL